MIKILFLILPFIVFAQSEKTTCETLLKINVIIQGYHYKPKVVDDSLSVYVFNSFLKELDEHNRFFTEKEIKNLRKHLYKIDNYIISNKCDFLLDFYNYYSRAIERYKTTLESIQKEELALDSNDTIEFSLKSFPYSKDDKDLKRLFKKRIVFHILRDIAETSTNRDSLITNFESLSQLAKNKIFETYLCKYSGLQISKKDFYAKFIAVFCTYFDPHTMHLSQSDKSSFLSNVSADNLSFGLNIAMNEKEEIIVEQVVPGSSAYLSNKISNGDQVLKISHAGKEYVIACSSIQKIEEIITSSEYKKIDFTLRKKSGEVYTVTLTKNVMKDYDNNVYSYILKKDNKKIGYLKIPSFYATFENGKTNVSDDVKKEIIKLKKDAIEGLIIDLQDNGGGSMEEAVQLTGMFIDSGPMAVMKSKSEKKETIKDSKNGSVYEDSIVLLINAFSASASEFFANALQDYKRAVVVGTKSHGKATMQRIIPLNTKNNEEEYLKLTIEAFYRVTGKTNQNIGIIPDVELPLLFDKQMPRESSFKTALKNDTIYSILNYTTYSKSKRNDAVEKSKKRVENDANFKSIIELNSKINKVFDEDLPPIALNFNAVFDSVLKMNSLWKDILLYSEKEYDIDVKSNSTDAINIHKDVFLQIINKEKIKAIKNNLHVIEAVKIFNDL